MRSYVTYEDAELVRLFQSGEEAAFNTLFTRYRNRIFNYLLKVTKSKEAAEEAALDVFLKIWKARSILHEINSFEAFLFRVVQNHAIDCLRRAQRSRMMQQEIWNGIESLLDTEKQLASTTTADEKILAADAAASIRLVIGKLPARQQEVFRLSREENLSYDQIARRMNISRNTVRNQMVAALQFIRGHLDNGAELATILTLISRT